MEGGGSPSSECSEGLMIEMAKSHCWSGAGFSFFLEEGFLATIKFSSYEI